jgi:hypothetical protein
MIKLIRRILKEQSEEWIDISPEDYYDLLKYVNGDGSLIKKIPQYKGKKINITGDLDLSRDTKVSNIDSINYVTGNLNIDNTNISYFDKDTVKGRFSNMYSKMYKIEKKKILNQKLNTLDGYRQEGEWDVTNNDEESNKTEALFMHLKEDGFLGKYENNEGEEVSEDKYFIWETKYRHYGDTSMYEWLGEFSHESEWIVIPDDKIEYVATEQLKQQIDAMGYESFSESIWANNLNEDEVHSWLYDFYEGMVRDSPEEYDIEKNLSLQQEKYVEVYEKKINILNSRLVNEDLTDEEIEEIEDDIFGAEELIKDIKENPEGDYSEDGIEGSIESQIDDSKYDFPRFLIEMGYDSKYILDFVDIDAVCEDVINSDGYGNILNGYDGKDDEYKVNGKWYHVMRYN